MNRAAQRFILLASVAIAASTSSRAIAHRFEHPKVLRLGVTDTEILLSILVDVNPGEDALRTRALFDRNTDGRLDEGEQAKLTDYLSKLAWLWLEVTLDDGKKLRFEQVGAERHRMDRPVDSADTLGAALLFRAPIPRVAAGALKMTVRDRDRDRRKHVPLDVDLAEGWRLETHSQGRAPEAGRRLEGVELDERRTLEITLRRRPPGPPGQRP